MAVRQRCEKHGIEHYGSCIRCVREHMESPEGKAERAAFLEHFERTLDVVLPFAEKLKKIMVDGGKRRVRTRCPREHKDQSKLHWVRARISGPRNHMWMACDDPECIMRMME